jgi:hypothetical protein
MSLKDSGSQALHCLLDQPASLAAVISSWRGSNLQFDQTATIQQSTLPIQFVRIGVCAVSAWWHAVRRPGAEVLAKSGGSCSAQIDVAFQQRERKRHPLGGLMGLGKSP